MIRLNNRWIFYIPAIATGSYEIELVGVDNPPAPLLFSIGAKDEWISDLELFWYQQFNTCAVDVAHYTGNIKNYDCD